MVGFGCIQRVMTDMRSAVSVALAWALLATPAFAQPATGNRARVWTGALIGAAGGTAIVLGTTVVKSDKTTSGNTPNGAFDNCVALKNNPVYAGNDCAVLKGPSKPLVIGGAIAAAAGATLMMLGLPNSSVHVTPGGFGVTHRVKF
jgi:hypothetical protein